MSVTVTRREPTQKSGMAGRRVSGSIEEALPNWQPRERWLFVTPHDDDIAVGGALLVQAGVRAGAEIEVRVATDGRMGYTESDQRERIVTIRREETVESFKLLGVDRVSWYGYPDADLYRHAGRRRDETGHGVDSRFGHTGLQNSLTADLRALEPDRVFVLSGNDYHPDHKVVHQELLISLFHAQGVIWPELGSPLKEVPPLYELAAYCPFASDPDIQLRGDEKAFATKLESIRRYRSQRQIEALVKGIEESGPFEYLRTYPYAFYRPDRYHSLFTDGS